MSAGGGANPLQLLAEHGQSFWIDSLDRPTIRSGKLAEMARADGLRGVTSNPAIFLKAISSGDAYDDQIHELAGEGRSVGEIYEAVVVQDVRDACDVLADVHRATGGLDGFVSLEVSPYVAHDARATLEEVHRLHAAVDRPNLYIKIPGTEAGLVAIEEALHAGVNVNITLLFGVERYRRVAEAYVRALERRVSEGLAVEGVSSVASFFLSRIDVLADRLLAHRITGADDSAGPRERGPSPPRTAPRTARVRPRAAAGDSGLPQHLLGRAAIANARVAHQVFLDLFSGERWSELAERGARVQRLLWASTGNKNPLYDELRYVEPLIGPDTVNTMPLATAEAFRARGTVADTLSESGPEGPRRTLARLAQAGVPIERVTERLEDEAVQKFVDPFDDLMTLLAERRDEVLADGTIVTERAGGLSSKLDGLLETLQEQRVPRRLFDLDASLWARPGAGDGGRSENMGWLTHLDVFAERVDEIRGFADDARREGLDQVLLLGMGGSSRWADAFARAHPRAETRRTEASGREPAVQGRGRTRRGGGGAPTVALHVLDDTHPEAVRAAERALDLSRTLVIVASKSGTTLETLSLYRHFLQRVEEGGSEDPANRFVAITDPGTPLSDEAERIGFRHVFENPPGIGGRYSALSYFGLVPMALLGVDVGNVLASARRMRLRCDPLLPAAADPAIRLGALLGTAARNGRDKVTLELDEALAPFGGWIEQLLAESTGKRGRGLVPVVGEPPGAPDGYGEDRLFVQMRLRGPDDGRASPVDGRASPDDGRASPDDGRARALVEAGHPVVSLEVPSLEEMGGEMLRWALATVTAAAVLGVDPFDQPDVELTKRVTEQLLDTNGRRARGRGEAGTTATTGATADAREKRAGAGTERSARGERAEVGPGAAADPRREREEAAGIEASAGRGGAGGTEDAARGPADVLSDLLERARPGDYVALLAYFPETQEREARLSELRAQVRDATGLATTLGYGPRYLHSTGQLHKGGPNSGLFALVAGGEEADLPIPDTPYGFGGLHRTQLEADHGALAELGRRVVRVDLGPDIEAGLAELVGAAGEMTPAEALRQARAPSRKRRVRTPART